MIEHKFFYKQKFYLENGGYLPELEITYHTAGEISLRQDNVIWICHALTANSNVFDWWDGLAGPGKLFDPEKHFIICANVLGSCYGSTGPLSINPETDKSYYLSFPRLTIRDIVNAHDLLRQHLGIQRIHTITGGSIGGFQSLEWAISQPDIFDYLLFIASSPKVSPWATAFNESQRMAIRSDKTFFEEYPEGGRDGLKTARSIALLSYRNAQTYNKTQEESDDSKHDNLKACSYQQYQGEKLAKRFNAYTYDVLTKALDSQNVGRGRGGVEKALNLIKAKTLLVSISSDLLFPPEEQLFMKSYIKNSVHREIESFYGHDGFLIESLSLTKIIREFYDNCNFDQ